MFPDGNTIKQVFLTPFQLEIWIRTKCAILFQHGNYIAQTLPNGISTWKLEYANITKWNFNVEIWIGKHYQIEFPHGNWNAQRLRNGISTWKLDSIYFTASKFNCPVLFFTNGLQVMQLIYMGWLFTGVGSWWLWYLQQL